MLNNVNIKLNTWSITLFTCEVSQENECQPKCLRNIYFYLIETGKHPNRQFFYSFKNPVIHVLLRLCPILFLFCLLIWIFIGFLYKSKIKTSFETKYSIASEFRRSSKKNICNRKNIKKGNGSYMVWTLSFWYRVAILCCL